ncbi:EAL domain-containing protein [Heyndrickxia acidicola]|uniref:EAL domain-containing protein n=1 Tax=Heyndrickxia acidicola TaxID=209389 RepID=A0ABU6MM09_9BACI|nr:EAL domain-containing protein [Heyndrickxia acidicola]MED1204257.1 EAL domain-containing protein [Heyndrickxia acidicola]
MNQIKNAMPAVYKRHPIPFNKERAEFIYIVGVEPGPTFRLLFANEDGLGIGNINMGNAGKLIEELVNAEDFQAVYSSFQKVVDTKRPFWVKETVQRNNQIQSYETHLEGMKDNEGNIQCIISITREVSSLIEEFSRHPLFESNSDGVISIHEDGSIIEANNAMGKLLGIPENELENISIYSLFEQEKTLKLKNLLDAAFKGINQEPFCHLILSPFGNEVKAQLKLVPFYTGDQVTSVYIVVRDITENTKNLQTIEYMAYHDYLTGLGNRRSLMEDLTGLVEKSGGDQVNFAVLYMDIDRFKYFNDTFGHQAGDELLRQIAKRLKGLFLKETHLYRQGGDEFVIVLKDSDRKKVCTIAQKLLVIFHEPFMINEQDYYITPSIGISMYPSDGKDAESLIKNADSALYRVKQKGRGHFQFYRSDMNEAFPSYILMESHLRKAIEKNEFTIHYQPQVNLNTGRTTSFEALLRWNNRKFGNVPPAQFIPLAEETGLIISIGEWVIETVCRQISEWHLKGYKDIRVAVNISPKQFQQPSLPVTICEALQKYGLQPSSLEIEITEGAMEDTRVTLTMLQRLKEIGVIISVDDFGTGYSSLNYLKQFPIDILKIDQSFVKEIQVNEKDAAITKTIIHLAHNLGMEVVAEGVEEKGQVQFLLSARCQKAQGFYFSKPVTAEEIEKKLECV